MPEPEPAEPGGEDIPLNIVFEDDDIIVIDKPAGLVVHPAAGHATGTLVNALIAHCGDSLSGIGGVKRPGIVHRLDKDTTGLMVVAKTDRAHQALAAQFADHGRTGPLRRGYLAFVWGAPARPKGTIDAPIDRHPKSRDRMAVRANGREAITHWQVLERFDGKDGKPAASLIECRLETGRTHQIRVHLAHLGHPLLGDATYGTGFKTKATRLPEAAQEALAGPWTTGPACLSTGGAAPDLRAKAGVPIGTAGRSRPFTSQLVRRLTSPHLRKIPSFQGLDGVRQRSAGGHAGVKRFFFLSPHSIRYNAALRSGICGRSMKVPSARGATVHIACRVIRGQT